MWLTLEIVLSVALGSFCLPTDDVPGRTALDNYPLIDGHNDLAYSLYLYRGNKLTGFNFDKNLTDDPIFNPTKCISCKTDIPRLRAGKVGGQFWAAYVNCMRSKHNISDTLEQIDVIKRLIQRFPDHLKFTTTADGILEAFKEKKIASLIGVEGGHSIGDRLSVLRAFYELGVRYLTLTHMCNLNWADSSIVDDPNYDISYQKKNLTDFGKKVVLEMNRLGMLVDLAHVSRNVMSDTLDVTKAPVIFSHSSSKSIFNHPRNVDDEMLKRVTKNKGIVMVNFYSGFIAENATIQDVAKHINHIADVAGIDHVGIGSDFDGVPKVPIGLEDVSKYPDLFDLLREQDKNKWTIENLEKLAGRNFIRVFKEVERVRDELENELPADEFITDVKL